MNEYFRFTASSKSKIYAPTILNAEGHIKKCSKCGSVYLEKEFEDIDLLIEGNGELPDIISCGHWPLLVVSNKVLTIWNEEKISGFKARRTILFRKNEGNLVQCPELYHYVFITGCCELDLDVMGVKINNICSNCGITTYDKESWEFGMPIIKENSWDGSDMFVLKGFSSASICGIKNLKLAYDNKFTNFMFSRFEDMFDYTSDEINIKRLFRD